MARRKKQESGREVKIDARLARALNHPTRARILAILNERSASPVELSELLDIELSSVSYHARELLKLDCIEVVKREQVRGAMKTTYRASARMLLDDDTWRKLSKETRGGISAAAVGEVIDRAFRAIEEGTFDGREDRHVITLKMNVDEEGWSEISEIIADAYRRVSDVEAKQADGNDKPIRMTVSLLSYESP
jgi:DNA-binding transcriptional ArsR family regulator